MTPLDSPWFGQPDGDSALTWSDKIAPPETPEPEPEPSGGPAGLRALCEAAVERHLAALTAPLAGLSEQQLRRLRPAGPFDLLPPPLADRLTSRLLRRRQTMTDLPLLYALTSPRQTTARLTGKAAGCRAHAVALQLRAPRLQQLVCDVTCDCDGTDTCDGYDEIVRLAAGSRDLRVFIDSSQHCLGGAALRRLLTQCPRLERLSVRLDGTADLRPVLGGRVFPGVHQLGLTCRRSGCWDVRALSRLFPALRQLSLSGRPTPPGERCTCRYRVGAQLERLEAARLEHVCGTAAAAVRAGARHLHTLRLRGCSLSTPDGERSAGRRRSLRDMVRTVLRRRLTALPNIQVRCLEISADLVDAALVNHHFPCLKTLAVECAVMAAEVATPAAEPLWFPCLERLSVRLAGRGCSWAEPAILQRPLPWLTDYRQSFGCLRLRQLSASCRRLERLSLDPVMLAESGETAPLAALRQLTVGWCDSGTLAQMAPLMPALQRVHVLDPPSLDKRRWVQLETQLAQRGVQVALEW